MNTDESPFLTVSRDDWLCANDHAFAFFDRFPVNPGHVLVVTHRLVPDWFAATAQEQAAVMQLVNEVKRLLDQQLQPRPDGYNLGLNCGTAAGQTVMHLHAHVIPRYRGDVADPRGGVRYVIPHKANYLATDPKPASTQSAPQLATTQLWDRLSSRMFAAQTVDILASFVQLSGLEVIEQRLFESLRQGTQIRVLVSDYLEISDPRALARLQAWQELVADDDTDDGFTGQLQVRLFQTSRQPVTSFHPKAWRIVDPSGALVSVGSSNLSRAALLTGIEWNLLTNSPDAAPLPQAFDREFASLWQISDELTAALVRAYSQRASRNQPQRTTVASPEAAEPVVPRPWQQAALAELAAARQQGCRRTMVAVATGMGKTWLAALDIVAVGDRLGRRPRVLVIAHRAHILAQAEAVISAGLNSRFDPVNSSWSIGSRNELAGELVIASIQKLSRPAMLEKLADERFDYVVIDEVHHAQAPTYRRVLAQLQADFTLGLTATPERADGLNVVSLFDDNLVYHASIGQGIDEQSLVPFHYIGIRDTVDFQQIPWRNGRFDPEELERQVAVSERMERLATTLTDHPGKRTLVFCCSRRHALFARDWLRNRGMTAAAVFSGTGSDSYDDALEQMRSGQLSLLCVVDMFNEGLDIPSIDRVVMLRPTESKVVFLQQLGRGLRASEGKSRLIVIDFVGNHRVFAQRLIHLLSLGDQTARWDDLRAWLGGAAPSLPPGCLLDVEVAAQDVLSKFLPGKRQADLEAYRALRDELGRRPTPTELFHRGYNPTVCSATADSWFAFIHDEGDLESSEASLLESHHDWLKTVQTTRLNKSYKMVVLRVLLDQGQLFQTVDVRRFAQRCRRFLQEHPILSRDLSEGKHAIDHQSATDDAWADWWIKWPISRWTDEQNGHRWFELTGNQFRWLGATAAADQATLESMTDELVQWRLAQYVQSKRLDQPATKQQQRPPASQPTPPPASQPAAASSIPIVATVPARNRYRSHVPVYDLIAAAGGFGAESSPEVIGWVPVSSRRLSEGMFAARVQGRSMEPTIRSGSLCLFRPCPAGSRNDRLLLVQSQSGVWGDEAGRFTVKRYRSTKTTSEDGWQHTGIQLEPLNPEFAPIVVDPSLASELRVLGEFVDVISGPEPLDEPPHR